MSAHIDYVTMIRNVSHASLPPPSALTLDVETTMEGPSSDPMPYGPSGAKPILWALKRGEANEPEVVFSQECLFDALDTFNKFIVAHNIKFDWQHLMRVAQEECRSLSHIRRTHRLMFWDTGIAEYILTAQTSKFVALSDLTEKYGTASKGDILEEYIKSGKRSQDIPIDQFSEYAKTDVAVTYEIMAKQWCGATPRQRALIMIHSAQAVIFAEAEFRGMRVDLAQAVERRDIEDKRVAVVLDMFKEIMIKFVLDNTAAKGVDVGALAPREQFATPRALSMIMFGHPQQLTLECPLPVPIGRTKKARALATLRPSWAALNPEDYGAPKHADGMSYLMDEGILSKIAEGPQPVQAELAKAILVARASMKKSGTYYQGLIEAQDKYADNTIHHTLNVTATSTGRTSSSNPNSQNQPEEVKEIFIPQTGDVFCEFDFRQLEVWGLSELSKDDQLARDLKAGVDIHYETGKSAGLWTMPSQMKKETRRRVKSVVFGLIYGGGTKTLAEQSGLDRSSVAKIISAFYGRYPKVKKFHDSMVLDVANGATTGASYLLYKYDDVVATLGGGGSRRKRIMEVIAPGAATGRRYAFPESVDFDKFGRRPTKWSPTNIKNYPVQGFATGDIVPLALVLLDMQLRVPSAHIVTAVHDSGLLSVMDHKAVIEDVNECLRSLPSDIGMAAKVLWDLQWSTRPGISVEWKPRWGAKPTETYNVV